MKYKAIIFDLDGTLLDTADDLKSSLNRVLVKRRYTSHRTQSVSASFASYAEKESMAVDG